MNLSLLSSLSVHNLAAVLDGRQDCVLGGSLIALPAKVTEAFAWPQQRLRAALPGLAEDSINELWLADTPCQSGESAGLRWRRSASVLFGVIELDESEFPPREGSSPLQDASAEAYRRIFSLLDSQQLPHLWRVWNYLAEINAETAGLERYRQFNIGRQDSFLEFRRGATGNVPAACALGVADGPLSIAFMAGAHPAVPVENPRQISAYNYPTEYGPRSPIFSRAVLVYPPGQEILFISGTASIVGHQTVHPGDLVGQCRESVANISAVLDEANRLACSAPFVLSELSYRIYIRHAADLARVRDALPALIGVEAPVVFVQADICRLDLLIEIEAFASHPRGVADGQPEK